MAAEGAGKAGPGPRGVPCPASCGGHQAQSSAQRLRFRQNSWTKRCSKREQEGAKSGLRSCIASALSMRFHNSMQKM